jgi:hypothetical protein
MGNTFVVKGGPLIAGRPRSNSDEAQGESTEDGGKTGARWKTPKASSDWFDPIQYQAT